MTTELPGRPTVAVIDAASLRHNFTQLRARLPVGVGVLAVVKANGYGHGAQLVGPILEAAGAEWLGVATVEEAIELRGAGVHQRILVLTGASGLDIPTVREHDLTVALLHRDMARDLATAAHGYRVRIHIKVDTGMGRIGVLPAELEALLETVRKLGAFEIDGLFSHFANADSVERAYSDYQLAAFQQALEVLARAGVHPRWIHLANSAATLSRPDAQFSLVRPGIALYGVPPASQFGAAGLLPVMKLRTRVWELKRVPSEFPVSYGQTFVTRRPSVLAVVPIGYADGYDRRLSNRGEVLVRGRRAPVVGAVCMDLTVIDVTDVPGVQVGDEVVLWGRQDGAEISVTEVAQWQGTVPYEVLTRLGPRVPRILEPTSTPH